jgi:hypothetical protein
MRGGGIGQLMKQAQQMQEKMAQAQEKLAALEVCGEAGGGMVKVHMNGRHEVRRVEIDRSVIGEDKEMLEDLLAAAMNDAVRKVEASTQQMFAGLAQGVSLPPGFKMPF